MSIKVALTGRIRSGKDTVADMFVKDGYKEFKFGTGIAEIIQKYYPVDWMRGKPREHYQHIGQQLRVLDKDVWVKYAIRQVNTYLEDKPNADIIISDMRQENEAEILRKQGFLIIKIVSSKENRVSRMVKAGDVFTEDSLEHETEKQSDKIIADITIVNDGTLKDLKQTVHVIKQQIAAGTVRGVNSDYPRVI